MKQLLRRIGKTFAFVLPVVLVTTGTLAVTRVPWAPPSSGGHQVLAAAAADGTIGITSDGSRRGRRPAPQEALRRRLLRELRVNDPGTALAMLDRSMRLHPSLTPHCTELAQELGRAAVRKYHGDVSKAQSFSRPVCDGSFAAGTVDPGH